MSDTRREIAETRAEVLDLIAFYEARGWNWLSAAEFTLAKRSGTFEALMKRPRWRKRHAD